MDTRKLSRKSKAFSLVEVTLALGIVSFTIAVVLGLLPASLTAFQNAKRDAICANIIQDVAGNANLTAFSNVANMTTNVYYYDDQGQLLSTTSSSGAVYKASFASINNPPLLPGQTAISSEPYGTTNMYVLQVRVDVLTGSAQAISSLATTNSIYVSNQGK